MLLSISDNVVLLTVFFKEYSAEQAVYYNVSLLFNVNNLDVKLLKPHCLILIYAVM